jgi:hypothetical protein
MLERYLMQAVTMSRKKIAMAGRPQSHASRSHEEYAVGIHRGFVLAEGTSPR